MQTGDLEQVVPIEAANFSTPWTGSDFSVYLEREDGLFLVAEEDGKVLGYCGVIMVPPEGDITNVSVSSDSRRKGAGRALVEEMLKRTKEKGVDTLFLEVRKSNEAAITLYRNQGFTEIGLRKNYYEAPVEDALIMTRQ
ncbi:MAG: ribosomal protein S18-alanine N-acetyltransferase, partial [Lachnospiraceae bacterium]|nr:ribosomal protein S18-alanine N-acetyltransferase [Lachnospiraceae bacterium]